MRKNGELALLFCAVILQVPTTASAMASSSTQWMSTWAASPESQPNTAAVSTAVTYRQIIHTSAGGNAVRLVVTNEFGLEPLTIGAARIAVSTEASGVNVTTARTLTFGGQPSVTLPAGTLMLSDPISMPVPGLTNLAISLFIPAQPMTQSTVHSYALQTNYIAQGNVVDAPEMPSSKEERSWYFIKGIQVQSEHASVVVALGDSITDGAASAPNTNGRWPDVLAARLAADKRLAGTGVVNAGINGNRLLHEGSAESALRRLDRDVLTQAGAKYLVVLEGINDIGHLLRADAADPAESSQRIIQALLQIAWRAHAQGIKIIGATILPYGSCKYDTPEGEKMRQAVNQWIRTTKELDAVADFEMVVRDPAHPTHFLPAYDSGDHLHPNAAGLSAMANSIDLGIFTH